MRWNTASNYLQSFAEMRIMGRGAVTDLFGVFVCVCVFKAIL